MELNEIRRKIQLEEKLRRKIIRQKKFKQSEQIELAKIIYRDLKDYKTCELSKEWQFMILFNAILNIVRFITKAHGHDIQKEHGSKRAIDLIHLYLGEKFRKIRGDLQVFRRKRNRMHYYNMEKVEDFEFQRLEEISKVLIDEIKKHEEERCRE